MSWRDRIVDIDPDEAPKKETWRDRIREGSAPPSMLQAVGEDLGNAVVEHLPALGAMGGGMVGGIPGAGLGGFAGAAVKNAYNTFQNPKEAPQTNLGYITDPLMEGAGGAAAEAVGQKIIGPAVNLGLKGVGVVAGAAKKGISKVGDYILKKTAKTASNIPE